MTYADELTPKQRALIDAYMTNGFKKKEAFLAAGYHCDNPKRLGVRVAKLFSSPAVRKEIARRQHENFAELNKFSPLQVMSANLDFWFSKALDERLDEGERIRARVAAQEVAKEAAPYVHPRLQAVALRASLTERPLADYSDEELDGAIARIEQGIEALSFADAGPSGKGKATH